MYNFPDEPIKWIGHQIFFRSDGTIAKHNVLYIGYEYHFFSVAITDGRILIDKHNGQSIELKPPFKFLQFQDDNFSSLVGKTIYAFQIISPIDHDYLCYGIIFHFLSGEKLLYYENESEEMILTLTGELPAGLVALPAPANVP